MFNKFLKLIYSLLLFSNSFINNTSDLRLLFFIPKFYSKGDSEIKKSRMTEEGEIQKPKTEVDFYDSNSKFEDSSWRINGVLGKIISPFFPSYKSKNEPKEEIEKKPKSKKQKEKKKERKKEKRKEKLDKKTNESDSKSNRTEKKQKKETSKSKKKSKSKKSISELKSNRTEENNPMKSKKTENSQDKIGSSKSKERKEKKEKNKNKKDKKKKKKDKTQTKKKSDLLGKRGNKSKDHSLDRRDWEIKKNESERMANFDPYRGSKKEKNTSDSLQNKKKNKLNPNSKGDFFKSRSKPQIIHLI